MKYISLYDQFLLEREEILKHKWIESEKRGYDMGFENALVDWIKNHRKNWLTATNNLPTESTDKGLL